MAFRAHWLHCERLLHVLFLVYENVHRRCHFHRETVGYQETDSGPLHSISLAHLRVSRLRLYGVCLVDHTIK